MRRADRLFQLIVLLGRRRSVTGDWLAERLGVSRRTVYRDIRDLSLSGVPIHGEAGVGFQLSAGYQLPPLMFTPEEIQALVFGARLVQSCADEGLHAAADTAIAKVDAALPASLKHWMDDPGLIVPDFRVSIEVKRVLRELRSAVSGGGASWPFSTPRATVRSLRLGCTPCACATSAEPGRWGAGA